LTSTAADDGHYLLIAKTSLTSLSSASEDFSSSVLDLSEWSVASAEECIYESLPDVRIAHAWSDLGLNWSSCPPAKDFVKYASDSDMADALVMLEPGLRRIVKEALSSSSTEEDEPESGFYSIRQEMEDGKKHVTVISVNQNDGPTTLRYNIHTHM